MAKMKHKEGEIVYTYDVAVRQASPPRFLDSIEKSPIARGTVRLIMGVLYNCGYQYRIFPFRKYETSWYRIDLPAPTITLPAALDICVLRKGPSDITKANIPKKKSKKRGKKK